ncbi:MAG: PEP-CTERM sorting domain-containing protein [Planctomycetota bacterium]|jgi:hypothetical protein
MKWMIKKSVVLLVIAILGMGSSAFAVVEPPWRGDDRSTFQEWDFSTGDLNPAPNPQTLDNDYGDPLLRVDPSGAWIDLIPEDERQGVRPLEGQIDAYIPNYDWQGPDSKKEMWIQLTWKATAVDPFLPDEPLIGVTAIPFEYMHMARVDLPEQNGWVHSVFVVNLWPNPNEEWITIGGDIEVDYLAIDTRCVPEPATVLLLGVGGAMLILVRQRESV